MNTNTSQRQYVKLEPINVGRWVIWGLFLLVIIAAPQVFTSSLSRTMLSQMGIAIIVCLSYNILLGQGGMLSFGHAVYSGMGSFLAIHTLNRVTDGQFQLPVKGIFCVFCACMCCVCNSLVQLGPAWT